MGAAVFAQSGFRLRNDDGSETLATWIATENTSISISTNSLSSNIRVRIQIDETGASKSWSGLVWNLYYSINGGAYAAVTASTPIKFSSSTHFADGDDCTAQLTAPTGSFVTDNNGMKETTGGVTNSGAAGAYFETEWCLLVDAAQVSVNDTIDLRIYSGSTAIALYSQTPRITVVNLPPVAPTLLSPEDTEAIQTNLPSFEFYSSDPEGSDLEYNIQIDTVNSFDTLAAWEFSIADYRAWNCINDDGDIMIVTYPYGVLSYYYHECFISTDYGYSWSLLWPKVTRYAVIAGVHCSHDGSVILINETQNNLTDNGLYRSTNYGSSFTTLFPRGTSYYGTWKACAMTGDGNTILVGNDNSTVGRLYLSTNGGTSWTEPRPLGDTNHRWSRVAISDNGQKMLAAVWYTRLYVSTNGGSTWAETQPAGDINKDWFSLAISRDGAIMMAGAVSGRLYISTNDGSTWTEVQPAGNEDRSWLNIKISGDKSIIIASTTSNLDNGVYLSYDQGSTWSYVEPEEEGTGYYWYAAIGNTGNYIIGSGTSGVWIRKGAPLINVNSEVDAGFENITTPLDTHPFNSGDTIRYTLQAGDELEAGVPHYWRVRAGDV